jgi:curved DNA-binding protein
MDYYSTLGVDRNATPDEIKKAYRSMAMKHHPDRGGDEAQFKKISEAYDVLSDPVKRDLLGRGIDPNKQPHDNPWGDRQWSNQGSPFEFHFGGVPPGMEDVFSRFGFGGAANFTGQTPRQRNKSLNISIDISLDDVLTGKELNAEITIPGTGKRKMINIHIPAGIESGQQIKYEGMGDDSIPGIRPGDLIVNVNVLHHHLFRREGNNIIFEKTVSVWDAILGSKFDITTLDKKILSINVPAGTQPGTVLSCKFEGLPVIRSRNRGNLLIVIKIEVPVNLSNDQIEKIQQIANRS